MFFPPFAMYCGEDLASVFVQHRTVIAQPVFACARLVFLRRFYVTAWSTCAVVVMNAICSWLLDFVNGVEIGYRWHNTPADEGMNQYTDFARGRVADSTC
jgi:hypothetical protein